MPRKGLIYRFPVVWVRDSLYSIWHNLVISPKPLLCYRWHVASRCFLLATSFGQLSTASCLAFLATWHIVVYNGPAAPRDHSHNSVVYFYCFEPTRIVWMAIFSLKEPDFNILSYVFIRAYKLKTKCLRKWVISTFYCTITTLVWPHCKRVIQEWRFPDRILGQKLFFNLFNVVKWSILHQTELTNLAESHLLNLSKLQQKTEMSVESVQLNSFRRESDSPGRWSCATSIHPQQSNGFKGLFTRATSHGFLKLFCQRDVPPLTIR